MSRAEYAATPARLTVREARFGVKDKTKRAGDLRIVTKLLDAKTYRAKDLGKLFRQRWHAEEVHLHDPARIEADLPRLLSLIGQKLAEDRPDRYEPMAVKRRPKPHRLLKYSLMAGMADKGRVGPVPRPERAGE